MVMICDEDNDLEWWECWSSEWGWTGVRLYIETWASVTQIYSVG